MTWRERQRFYPDDNGTGRLSIEANYERAKFKDAPFWVESYAEDAGRRQSVQRFPGDVYTNVQDLGLESSTFTINAFLVGENYDSELLWLKGRLTEGGSGELVLPWRNPFSVTVVGKISVNETKGERGYAEVSFECVETAEPPSAFSKDSAARMQSASDNARNVTRERFGDRYAINQPESRRVAFRDTLNDATARIVGIQGKVDGFISEIPKAANTVNRLSGATNDLINSPLDLSDEIVNAVITAYASLRSTTSTVQNVLETWGKGGPVRILMDQVFRFDAEYTEPVVETTSPSGAIEQQNLTEFNRLARLNMFYEAAWLMAEIAWESRLQALQTRIDWLENIDGLLLGATPKENEAISALNESVGAFLEEVADTLPDVGTYTPSTTLPAVVIALSAYGDATQEADVVLRNSIAHPNFVEGGTALEVLDVGL